MKKKLDLTKKLRSKKIIFSFIVSGIVIYLLSRMIDLGKTVEIIKGANIEYIALAFIVYALSIPVRGYRWSLLLKNIGFKGKPKDVTEIWFLAFFVNCLVPAKLGDIYRGYLIRKKYKLTISRVLGTVIIERLADITFLMIFLSISGYMVFGQTIPKSILQSIGYGYAVLAIVIASLMLLNKQREYVISILPVRFETMVHELEHDISRSFEFSTLPMIAVLTTVGWMTEILRLYIVTIALGISVPIYLVAFIGLLSSLLSSIPLTPSGIGAVELAVAGILVFVGYDINVAASVAILDRLISYVSFLIVGAVVYLRSDLK